MKINEGTYCVNKSMHKYVLSVPTNDIVLYYDRVTLHNMKPVILIFREQVVFFSNFLYEGQ